MKTRKVIDITFGIDEISFERSGKGRWDLHSYKATPTRIWRVLLVTGEWVRWERWAKVSSDLFEEHYGYRP